MSRSESLPGTAISWDVVAWTASRALLTSRADHSLADVFYTDIGARSRRATTVGGGRPMLSEPVHGGASLDG